MKAVLLACACAVLMSAPASACRGLWEYPETIGKLSKVEMPATEKAAYKKKLEDGFALHERGRVGKDRSLMKQAVDILDGIKVEIGN